jgi:diaminopimelate decarboxylase
VDGFEWRNGILHADDVPLPAIAEAVGTPTYVYSASSIRAHFERLRSAFAPLGARLHYAVKANPNLALLGLVRELGAGIDVVSGGELERAWLAGTPMADIVFAGVGKSDEEIRAALDGAFSPLGEEAGGLGAPDPSGRGPVGLFNVESASELEAIARLGRELGIRARACLRVNPDVDPHTHEYTTTGKEENKFGIDADQIVPLWEAYAAGAGHPGVALVGLHLHIGSPVPSIEPYAEAIAVALTLIDELERRGHRVSSLDLGGGWPVPYREGPHGEGEVPPVSAYAERIVPLLARRVARGLEVFLEPGRSIVANAGVLLSRVQHVKRGRAKTFVIGDGGMHTLLRPALYRAFHFAWPVGWTGPQPRWEERPSLPGFDGELALSDLVGPICETGDFLARGRWLPPMERGDLVAVFSAGAYGMSMASNYNDHGRPAEVLVEGDRVRLINERQSLAALFATERSPRQIAWQTPSPRLPSPASSRPAAGPSSSAARQVQPAPGAAR